MDPKKRVIWLVIGVGMLFFLSVCQLAPAPEPIAGSWSSEYDLGEIQFTIDNSNQLLTDLHYTIEVTPKCNPNMLAGSLTINSNITLDPGIKIENSKFEYTDQNIHLEGKFSSNGKSASGTWEFAKCSGKWKAIKE